MVWLLLKKLLKNKWARPVLRNPIGFLVPCVPISLRLMGPPGFPEASDSERRVPEMRSISGYVRIRYVLKTANEQLLKKWARPDSNRGPTPCKGVVITARPRARDDWKNENGL